MSGFAFVLKANPYKDAAGRFTSKEKANYQGAKVHEMTMHLSKTMDLAYLSGDNSGVDGSEAEAAYLNSPEGKKLVSELANMYWKYQGNKKKSILEFGGEDGNVPQDFETYLKVGMTASQRKLVMAKAQGVLNAKKAWIKIYQKKSLDGLANEYPELAKEMLDASDPMKAKLGLKLKKKIQHWKEQYIANGGDPDVFAGALAKAALKVSDSTGVASTVKAIETASAKSPKWFTPGDGSPSTAKTMNEALGVHYYTLRDKLGKNAPEVQEAYAEWQKSKDWLKDNDPGFNASSASTAQKEKAQSLLKQSQYAEQVAKATKDKTLTEAKAALKSAAYTYEYAAGTNDPTMEEGDVVWKLGNATQALKDAGVSDLEVNTIIAAATASAAGAIKSKKDVESLLGGGAQKSLSYYEDNADSFHPVNKWSPSRKEKYTEHMDQQVASLTGEQRKALKSYTSSGYSGQNKSIASESAEDYADYTAQASNVAAAMSTMTLGQDMKLRRNAAQKWFWKALGVNETDMDTLSDSDLEQFVGRTYTEKAFSSTSKRLDFTGTFSTTAGQSGHIEMLIRAKKDIRGVDVGSISNHENEAEVLLDKGLTYVIRGIKKGGGHGSKGPGLKYQVLVDAIGHV